jgi:hypothetical protein
MKNLIRMAAMQGFIFLSACAVMPDVKPATPAVPAPSQTGLGEVQTQPLKSGQCALALWARRMPPSRILVVMDKPAVAHIELDGKQIELVRVGQSGEPLYGQFPEQRFSGGGISLGVSFATDDARDVSGGAVLSSVVVEYVDAKGWTSVIPARGLIGCQA